MQITDAIFLYLQLISDLVYAEEDDTSDTTYTGEVGPFESEESGETELEGAFYAWHERSIGNYPY